jgi:hypothetical protein
MELACKRDTGKTFCPCDVAPQVDPNEELVLMDTTRNEGGNWFKLKTTTLHEKGNPLDPKKIINPIHFGLSPTFLRNYN